MDKKRQPAYMLSPGETSELKIHDTENGEIKKCHANGHEKNLG